MQTYSANLARFWAAHVSTVESLAVALGIGLAGTLFISLILQVMLTASKRQKHPLRSSIIATLRAPMLVLMWSIVAYFIGQALVVPFYRAGDKWILPGSLKVAAILVLGWAAMRVTRQVELAWPDVIRHRHGRDPDPMICDAMGKIARILIFIIIGLMILRVLDFSITSLLAFGGVAGIAIGFAAQGVVSNLFGALVIYLDRPFKVGEWIVLPSLNIYGTVEHIGWRATTMRGFDTRPYYVPNQIFNTNVVQTPPRMLARRIYETISIRYADFGSLEAIVDECRKFVAQNPEIDHRQSEMIYFTKFGNHALEIMVYCFANTQNWQESLRIQERLLIDLGRIIRRHGAEIAVPVSQVELSPNVSRPPEPRNVTPHASDDEAGLHDVSPAPDPQIDRGIPGPA